MKPKRYRLKRLPRFTSRRGIRLIVEGDALEPVEVGAKRFGHVDGAVFVLVVLDNRKPRSSHGESGPIQRVAKPRLPLGAGTVANACPPRLEIGARCGPALR